MQLADLGCLKASSSAVRTMLLMSDGCAISLNVSVTPGCELNPAQFMLTVADACDFSTKRTRRIKNRLKKGKRQG